MNLVIGVPKDLNADHNIFGRAGGVKGVDDSVGGGGATELTVDSVILHETAYA
jgi:hypothetical protein